MLTNAFSVSSNIYIPTEPCFKTGIHSIWQVDQSTAYERECIIPKGVVEIIFNFSTGSPILTSLQNKEYHLPACFINGFNTTPIQTKLPCQQNFFGVVLQPLAVHKITGCPAGKFADITIDATLLDKTFQSLWHQLADQNDFNNRVVVFLEWITKKIVDFQPQEQLLNDFLYAISQHELTVKALAASVCYSPRQLSRKMLAATGMNTESMLLYKKYLHAVHLIHHTSLSMTVIAYQSGFADQSHFIKSFKSFTQITPGEYQRNKTMVKGHLYQNVR